MLAILPLSFFIYFATFIPAVSHGEPVIFSQAWVPSLQINLDFYLDGLSLLMALLVTGVGSLIFIYAGGYMKLKEQGRFYIFITLFMGAMLGVVLADNLILLFIFWELTSITSYMLIGFKHELEKSQKSATQALIITGGGGLALLAGLILLGVAGGSWQISKLLEMGEVIRASSLYTPALILVLLGCFTKSAQFPFHTWLPKAMAGPTPVSAYLHSATMVKAGVYLLARLTPVLGGTSSWQLPLMVFGGITAVLGAWLCWQQTDLKRILAYSTIAALGLLVFLLGLGTKIGYEAAMLFLLVHSFYKGALFMTAGNIDHETGTREIDQLGGLRHSMRWTMVGVGIAALSKSGLPLFVGFIGKELIYEATWEIEGIGIGLTAVALLTNVFLVGSAGVLFMRPFFGKTTKQTEHVHEAPISMWLGPLVLGIGSVLFGTVLAEWIGEAIIAPAASAIYHKPIELHLHAIPNPTLIYFWLSVVTVALGVGIYIANNRGFGAVARGWDAQISPRVGPQRWYQGALDNTLSLADHITQATQNGYLRYYIIYALGMLLSFGGITLLSNGAFQWPTNTSLADIRSYEWITVLIIMAAAIVTVTMRSRLATIAALGVVGYGIALLYIFFSAPDLAMTQFTIETLTVVLFVLLLYRLPRFTNLSSRIGRARDILIASLVGLFMTGLVLTVTAQRAESQLSEFVLKNSEPLAHGENVVNVILVDFRGFDTLLEITVLSVAAIGVYTLLKLVKHAKDEAS